MSKPVFICVPEASSPSSIYEPVRRALSNHGYTAIPLALPSIGGSPPTYDFTQDVQAIRNLVIHVIDSGVDVIVVLHGYAGLPGGEALLGLSKREREHAGLRGGVTRLVFMMSCALELQTFWRFVLSFDQFAELGGPADIVPEGFQACPRGDVSSMPPYTCCNVKAGVFTVDPRSAASTFYNDMSIGQADYWSSQLLPQSLGIFWSRTTYAAWRWIPSTYVLCGNDQAMPLPYAKIVLNAARTSMPNMIDRVEKCEIAGHFVMLSQPEWTANMLRRAAGECL